MLRDFVAQEFRQNTEEVDCSCSTISGVSFERLWRLGWFHNWGLASSGGCSFTYLMPGQDNFKNRTVTGCPCVAFPCGLASSQYAGTWIVGLFTGCIRAPEVRVPDNKLEAACPFMIQPHKSYDVFPFYWLKLSLPFQIQKEETYTSFLDNKVINKFRDTFFVFSLGRNILKC